jgi:predicted GNAT family N-acyltransferase
MTADTPASVDVGVVDWQEASNALLAVRLAVFVDEQGVPPELEHDAHDLTALHLLATTRDGRPVATARMLADGHIGRMAVLPDWRGQGLGTRLLSRLLEIARTQGLNSVYLHAQCRAEPFYRRLGFVAEGGIFDDAGIDHRCMRRSLR